MYRIRKEIGNASIVSIENTDTKANVVIGIPTPAIINTITDHGYSIPGSRDEWSVEVNKETAEELAKLAMPMKKPIRDQSKKAKDLFKKPNNEIDAMDVMLGLASYS